MKSAAPSAQGLGASRDAVIPRGLDVPPSTTGTGAALNEPRDCAGILEDRAYDGMGYGDLMLCHDYIGEKPECTAAEKQR